MQCWVSSSFSLICHFFFQSGRGSSSGRLPPSEEEETADEGDSGLDEVKRVKKPVFTFALLIEPSDEAQRFL